jgi:hypothetical protein
MKRLGSIFSFTFVFFLGALAYAQTPAIPPAQTVLARNGMVVAQEQRAARIGAEILDRGGNAVDAAAAPPAGAHNPPPGAPPGPTPRWRPASRWP